MPITFNTNLAALGAQRNIALASNAASSSLSKLSSGSRVPQAKDDAAALAVGSQLKAEAAGLTQASNNATQAISLLQIADGALSTIGDILQRQKTLATQASSGQLGNSERALLNQEFVNLRSEINRIAQTANFNGNTLLNGGDITTNLNEAQQGSLAARGISVSFDGSVTTDGDAYRLVYNYTDNTSTNGTAESDTGILRLTNLTTGESQEIDIRTLITGVTAESTTDGAVTDSTLNNNLSSGRTAVANFNAIGVSITLDSNFNVDSDLNVTFGFDAASTATALSTTSNLVVNTTGTNGLTYAQIGGDPTGTAVTNSLRASTAYNAATGVLTITANETEVAAANNDTIQFSANGLEFSIAGGAYAASPTYTASASGTTTVSARLATSNVVLFSFDINNANVDTAITATGAGRNLLLNFGNLVFGGDEVTGATKSFNFKVGTGVTTNDNINITLSGVTTSALGIASSTIDTSANADAAITAINSAITTISSRRADIGASQSRLEFAVNNINVAIENTTAATSALLDVDVSSEITKFTSKQVLLQAGVSLLAQANQQPALLLRLLQ